MKLIDEAITGSNVKNCDHQCVEQPCQENGKCIPDRDSYFCSCKLGFVGDNCETGKCAVDKSLASRCRCTICGAEIEFYEIH